MQVWAECEAGAADFIKLNSADALNFSGKRPLAAFVFVNYEAYFCAFEDLHFILQMLIKEEKIFSLLSGYEAISFKWEETFYCPSVYFFGVRLVHHKVVRLYSLEACK